MGDRVKTFLDEVCSYVKAKRMHEEIRTELTAHVEDRRDAYMEAGMEREDATEKAIAAMGPESLIGAQLNKIYRPQTDWLTILLVLFMIPISGLLAVRTGEGNLGSYLLISVFGLALAAIFYAVDYRIFEELSWCFYGGMLVFLVAMHLWGGTVSGTMMWLMIGRLRIPVEGTYIFLALSMPGILRRQKGRGTAGMLCWLFFALLPTLFVTLSRVSYLWGTVVVVLTVVFVCKNYFRGMRKYQIFILITGAVAGMCGFLYLILDNSYRWQRFLAIFDRGASDPNGFGWATRVVDYWLSTSPFFGTNTNTYQGISMLKSVPNLAEDYPLVAIIANCGWAIGIFVLILMGVFIWRMFHMIRRVKDDYGFTLAITSEILLTCWFVTGILKNFNISPIHNSTPFLSSGRSTYMVCMVLVGIILSVWKQNRMMKKEAEPEEISEPRERHRRLYMDGCKVVFDLKGILVEEEETLEESAIEEEFTE